MTKEYGITECSTGLPPHSIVPFIISTSSWRSSNSIYDGANYDGPHKVALWIFGNL